jgi:hypothetical protein
VTWTVAGLLDGRQVTKQQTVQLNVYVGWDCAVLSKLAVA